MIKTSKSEYEELIQQAANDFFCLNKEDKDYSTVREVKKGKLWIAVWNYYKDVLYSRTGHNGENIYNEYSGIINECIGKCIESYKLETGAPFLHYINAAVKHEIAHERKKNKLCGLKIPRKISQLWNNLVKLAQSRGCNISCTENLIQIGKTLGKSEKDIRQAIEFGLTKITSEISVMKGAEINILASCKSDIGNPECDYEHRLEAEKRIAQFTVIDKYFTAKQKQVKPCLSALLTRKFYSALESLTTSSDTPLDFLFIDIVLFEELRKRSKAGEPFPSQQDIADRFKRKKTVASRMLNTFLKDIRSKVSTLSCDTLLL